MNMQRLKPMREAAGQLIRKYRLPLLVFLIGVILALLPVRTKSTQKDKTAEEKHKRRSICPRPSSSLKRFCPQSTVRDGSG